MDLIWTDWVKDPSADPGGEHFRTPYMDWYLQAELAAGRGAEDQASFKVQSQRSPGTRSALFELALPDLPLPKKAVAPGSTSLATPQARVNVLAGLNPAHLPEKNDVIIGVIDAGIAPAHARFRRKGGIGTRILSYWSQGGVWAGQAHLPFGREMMQQDIDRLMGGRREVDEAAFNRAAGLVDFTDPTGERWIETRAPHGTLVADLAGGCDPLAGGAMATFRDRSHLITVDLAPRISIGAAGSFLETFAIWAIRHIVDTADAIWQARFPAEAGRKGFPVVINLSYGIQAGPKDGSLDLQAFVRALNAGRPANQPVRIVLPAGNENLDQVSAVLAGRGEGEVGGIGWRVLPGDATSSYVEINTDPVDAAGDQSQAQRLAALSLTPPLGDALPPDLPPGPGYRRDLIRRGRPHPVARIYCRQGGKALHYVLCIAPTARQADAAPPGKWLISLGTGPLAKLHIQSDQQLTPVRGAEILSYFDDLANTSAALRYRRYNPDTSPRDSYGYDLRTGQVTDHEPLFVGETGPIRRQNTLNAIAGSVGTLTIAGYRASDGWPAAYSATARGFSLGRDADPRSAPTGWMDNDGGKGVMEAAGICEDSPWRAGRLGAGGRSGATVLMGGTSFATAEATRIVAGMMLTWLDNGAPEAHLPASATAFGDYAAQQDALALDRAAQGHWRMPPAAELFKKLGAGRLPRQDHGRLPR